MVMHVTTHPIEASLSTLFVAGQETHLATVSAMMAARLQYKAARWCH